MYMHHYTDIICSCVAVRHDELPGVPLIAHMGRGTCWYGNAVMGGVPAAATSPSDSCTTSNKLRFLAGTTKAPQKETARLTAQTETRRSMTSHQMANHLTALPSHKPAGRSDVRYRGLLHITHSEPPERRETASVQLCIQSTHTHTHTHN